MALKKVKPAVEKEVVAAAKTAEAVNKEPAAKAKAAAKVAKPKSAEPNVYIEFEGKQVLVSDIIAQATAAFKAANKKAAIKSLNIYVKPDEAAAYYVVNDNPVDDKINL